MPQAITPSKYSKACMQLPSAMAQLSIDGSMWRFWELEMWSIVAFTAELSSSKQIKWCFWKSQKQLVPTGLL